MITALALSMVLTAGTEPTLQAALEKALQRSPARVELMGWEAPLRCKGAFVPAPFDASGRVAVKVRGKGCEAWGWAQVKVIVPVATLLRDVRADEPLDAAWSVSEGEARPNTLSSVPAGARALRGLRRGTPLGQADFVIGPRAGTAITVRVVMGALSLEQRAQATACGGLQGGAPGEQLACATLPSGKKVAGVFSDGVLVVGGAP